MTLGEILKNGRLKAGLSLENVAQACGVSRTAIFAIEHGKNMPRFGTVAKLARLLNLDLQIMAAAVIAGWPDDCKHKWKIIQQGQTYVDIRCDLCGKHERSTWD